MPALGPYGTAEVVALLGPSVALDDEALSGGVVKDEVALAQVEEPEKRDEVGELGALT